jgi:hypothetical protein
MFQFSLRQLFILVTVLALAIVSLRYASDLIRGVIAMVGMWAAISAGILALVDRGQRQAFAIGFLAGVFGYGLLISGGDTRSTNQGERNIELDLRYNGTLPTTHLLRAARESLQWEQNFDSQGNTISARQRALNDDADRKAGRQPTSYRVERPPTRSFAQIGHLWFALLFGYLGGQFARFVYLRRMKEQPAQTRN